VGNTPEDNIRLHIHAEGDDMYAMLCFITFVGISSKPLDYLALSDLATFSISLGETNFNLSIGSGCF
jgi:hypothetical protein